jgi:xanthosine utilization system XapX-like protein
MGVGVVKPSLSSAAKSLGSNSNILKVSVLDVVSFVVGSTPGAVSSCVVSFVTGFLAAETFLVFAAGAAAPPAETLLLLLGILFLFPLTRIAKQSMERAPTSVPSRASQFEILGRS